MINFTYKPDPLKPQRGLDGFFHFNCVICGIKYKSKSPFSKTCSQLCRNIKGHFERSSKYASEIKYTKKYKHNAKLLGICYNKKYGDFHRDVLLANNYYFEVQPREEIYLGEKVCFYGEYGLVRISETTYKVIKKQHGI